MTERPLAEYLESTCELTDIRIGSPVPLGAFPRGDGVNFAIFSRHAVSVRLELYDHLDDTTPRNCVTLDPVCNRTGDIWHVWVKGLRVGQLYGYRLDGPDQPEEGHRFNPRKLLVDPFASAVALVPEQDFALAQTDDSSSPDADATVAAIDDGKIAPKCVVSHHHFDWEGDRPPRHPMSKTVIYELHVRGFTIDPSSKVSHPGTYRGLMAMIPYLKELGITAVELMPVQEFNEYHLSRTNPVTGERLKNFWGYDPVSFFAPKGSYSSTGRQGHQMVEFKEMVRAFHRAGIEVILDIVFNHTVEGNELGPTVSLRGIDNVIFYMLEDDKRLYRDYTGTGNTVNANHPVVRDVILEALRHWMIEMHVDGFRFDLASVLGRGVHGELGTNAPLLERIAEDPILRDVKLIAEAWDAAGAYEVGSFSERRWAEWNGRYRDDVRRFWRGDDGLLGAFASRLGGNSDIYQASGKGPDCSINFITAHDGFTLNDLVSYRRKHNESNGEGNRDGMDENYSDNHGIEGETDDPEIESVRLRQIKNFLVTLFVSRGVPMLLSGDEFRRTQRGNNNAYCQDNEISWVDWTSVQRHQDVHRFARAMIAFRRAHPVLSGDTFYTDADIHWLDPAGQAPNWFDPKEKRLGCLIHGHDSANLFLMFNAATTAATFTVPASPNGATWCLTVDTARLSPDDVKDVGSETALINQSSYVVGPCSSVILVDRS